MLSVLPETTVAGPESALPEHLRRRVLDEWATGVELSDVVAVAGLLRRGRAVPVIRPAVHCGARRIDYGELFDRVDATGPAVRTDENDAIGVCVRMLAALGVHGGASIRLGGTGDGVRLSAAAVAAAVADRRAVAVERRWSPVDPALGSADVRLVVAPPNSAHALVELLAAVADGATLVVPTAAQRDDPAALAALIGALSVTHVVAAPATLLRLGGKTALPGEESSRIPDRTSPRLPSVRRWDVVGNACPPGLSDWLLTLSPDALTSFAYAPPEYAGALARGPLDGTGRVRPIPGARLLVLDEYRRPVPPDVVGELWAGGAALAEDERAQGVSSRVVADPYPVDGTGGRLVRTGARARWNSEGWLVIETEPGALSRG
ncbi:AMP-binding protein [Nocardia wallacei]|uniref:AMP-binding protein n=1 Tax=Nocardia wallacei TaxID=480035 RepID=UPI002458C5FE|nr:AMP-binding protein [Nocardia wallacei]